MKQRAIPALGRVLPGLGARLLSELTRSGAPPADRDAQPPPPAATPGDFIALYRDAIERLEAQVARGDGHPPMRKREVDLMCRCLLSCATLADAIRCAREFGEMLTPRAGALSLTVRDGRATFRMDSLRRTRSPAACLVDLTGLFCYLQLFGWLIGQPLRPTDVWLGHPRRDDAMPLLGLFNAPVEVGRKTYGFAFDPARLECRVIRQPAEPTRFVDFPFRLIDAAPAVVSCAQQVRGFSTRRSRTSRRCRHSPSWPCGWASARRRCGGGWWPKAAAITCCGSNASPRPRAAACASRTGRSRGSPRISGSAARKPSAARSSGGRVSHRAGTGAIASQHTTPFRQT